MLDEKFSISPVYQWTLQKGREEGIAIGEARGEARGKAQAKAQTLTQMRKRVMEFVLEHFSSLSSLTNEIVAAINDPDSLLDLIVNLAQAQGTDEAEENLLKAQPTR